MDDVQEKEELEQLEEGRGANKFFDNDLEEEVDFAYGVTTTDGGHANQKDRAFVFGSKSPTQFRSDATKSPQPMVAHKKWVHLHQVLVVL